MTELEKTFALIKPDAVRAGKAEEIKQLIELNGFTIVAQQKLQLTTSRAQEFYGEHLGKPFFPKLVEFMTSGPVWALVLAKKDAIKAWRSLMGPTNCDTARKEAPRSLRAIYGTNGTYNATHGSDAPGSARREIKFFFPSQVLEPLDSGSSAKLYITEKLQPALSRALTALAREKPSAERFEAITFLANYLLQNNPNKPKVLSPDEWDPSLEEEDDEAEFATAQLAAAQRDAAQDAAAAAIAAASSTTPAAGAPPPPTPPPEAVQEATSSDPAAAVELPLPARQLASSSSARHSDASLPSQPSSAALLAVHSTAAGGPPSRPASAQQGPQAPSRPASADAHPPLAEQSSSLASEHASHSRPASARPASASSARPASASSALAADSTEAEAAGRSRPPSASPPVASVPDAAAAEAEGEAAPEGEGAEGLAAVQEAEAAPARPAPSQEEQEAAAIKVQAAMRGHLARKRVAAMPRPAPPPRPPRQYRVLTLPGGWADRPAVLKAIFDMLDTDHSGLIDKAEFRASLGAMSKLSGGRLALQLEMHLSSMDSNADQSVSWEEFQQHMAWASSLMEGDAEWADYIRDTYSIDVEEGPAPDSVAGGRDALLAQAVQALDPEGSGVVDKTLLQDALAQLVEASGGALQEAAQAVLEALEGDEAAELPLEEAGAQLAWVTQGLGEEELLACLEAVFGSLMLGGPMADEQGAGEGEGADEGQGVEEGEEGEGPEGDEAEEGLGEEDA
ncbi:hypothetical protein QJQ45_016351 [Haematococcus lacustris]|nr:hypothetical protein QJQ45_016351 [Haematococcus lacustris]